MKRFLVLLVIAFVGAAGWSVGTRLSSDALGMGVGILLGVLAGLPTALLVIAAGRGRERVEPEYDYDRGDRTGGQGRFQPQAPVIVLANPGYPASGPMGYPPQGYGQAGADPRFALPAPDMGVPTSQRRFKVVGENEEWVEEW